MMAERKKYQIKKFTSQSKSSLYRKLACLPMCHGHHAEASILGNRLRSERATAHFQGCTAYKRIWRINKKNFFRDSSEEINFPCRFKSLNFLWRNLRNGHNMVNNMVRFRAAWEVCLVVRWNYKIKVSPESLETNALGYEQHFSSPAGQPQVWIHSLHWCLMWSQVWFTESS